MQVTDRGWFWLDLWWQPGLLFKVDLTIYYDALSLDVCFLGAYVSIGLGRWV